LEEVRRADEAHKKDIEELEQELAEVEAQRKEYEDMLAGESQSQGRNVQLEDAQVLIFETNKLYYQRTANGFLFLGERIQRFESASSEAVCQVFAGIRFDQSCSESRSRSTG